MTAAATIGLFSVVAAIDTMNIIPTSVVAINTVAMIIVAMVRIARTIVPMKVKVDRSNLDRKEQSFECSWIVFIL